MTTVFQGGLKDAVSLDIPRFFPLRRFKKKQKEENRATGMTDTQ